MRRDRFDLDALEKQAQEAFSNWVAQYRLALNRATPKERDEMIRRSIDEVAREETPRHRRDLFELAKDFSDSHFNLATEPLPGYPSDAVGVLAACVYEWLKLRLDTYWGHEIRPSLAGWYLDLPGHYFLVQQDTFGWKEVDFEESDAEALLLRLAAKLLDRYEYDGPVTYRIVYTAPEETSLLEVRLQSDSTYYTPEDGHDITYHVWTGNWNHNAGTNFYLARAILVTELLRACRDFNSEVNQKIGHEASLLIVDEGLRPDRSVWEVSVQIGSRIGAEAED